MTDRFKLLYNHDFTDLDHYDLVIDTCILNPDEVVSQIIQSLDKAMKSSPADNFPFTK